MTGTIKIDGALSPQQTAIWETLCERESDVVKLFAVSTPSYGPLYPTHREMQQRVGSKITRINRKVKEAGYKIVPGESRRTYRIIKI